MCIHMCIHMCIYVYGHEWAEMESFFVAKDPITS